MKREERLQQIAADLYDISAEDKRNKTEREELKQEFFRLLQYDFTGRDHILPVKTIEVPDAFWEKTGMSKEEFVRTRFPGWNVEHCEKNVSTGKTVFVLKQDPQFIPGVVDVNTDDGLVRVSKEVAEYTPQMDWETLAAERPDLFDKLSKTRVVLDLDEDALEKLAAENPEELATLQRHMIVKEPALKVQPRKVKDG